MNFLYFFDFSYDIKIFLPFRLHVHNAIFYFMCRDLGFEVDSILNGKRVEVEKLLNIGDYIIEINGTRLAELPYATYAT